MVHGCESHLPSLLHRECHGLCPHNDPEAAVTGHHRSGWPLLHNTNLRVWIVGAVFVSIYVPLDLVHPRPQQYERSSVRYSRVGETVTLLTPPVYPY